VTRRIKLTVAYLGTPFHGWQRQRGQRTVQGELEAALARITGHEAPPVVGSGRTDAGVHARGQVAHVDLPEALPVEVLLPALNGTLPREIRILGAREVPARFHARRSARAKHYAYRLHWAGHRLPWSALRSTLVDAEPDPAVVRAALEMLVGRHDMASFTVTDPAQGPTVRTILGARAQHGHHAMTLHFVGEGFLRYQVRRMVGAILEASRAGTVREVAALLETPTPGAPVPTAPPEGLTLEGVLYRPWRPPASFSPAPRDGAGHPPPVVDSDSQG